MLKTCYCLALFFVTLAVSIQPLQAQTTQIENVFNQSLTQDGLVLLLTLTILSLAPGILITITCFSFVITIFSILRQAIGVQQAPPNMLIIALALFLTYFIMEPVLLEAWGNGFKLYIEQGASLPETIVRAYVPFERFMLSRTENSVLAVFLELRNLNVDTMDQPPASVLLPSFMVSEISRAMYIGFLIFLPFLIIDLVVAAILMSMGMMMVPPIVVSLPFKLAFFVVADGWILISESIIRGYTG